MNSFGNASAETGIGCRSRLPAVVTAVLVLCLFLQLASFAAQPSTNGPVEVPQHPNSKISEQLRAKWGNFSSNELFTAAQTGIPEAQYFYGQAEVSAARNDHQQAWVYEADARSAKVMLNEDEKAAARAKWSNISDAELRTAAITADRDARWYFTESRLRSTPERVRRGVEWIKRAADQSYPPAEYSLARWYLPPTNWVEIDKNIPLAMKLLRHAADNGIEIAQHELANLLLAGEIVPRDVAKGIDYLQKAADQSCIHAEYELASQYANGNGEPRSQSDTVMTLLKKAAKANFNLALYDLGDRYRTGLGVHRDFVRAILLYRGASYADRRIQFGPSTSAYSVLGLVDTNLEPRFPLGADFVPFAQFLSLYCKATERNDLGAMHELGKAYLKGEHVPLDLVEAFRWVANAAAHGHVEAARTRDTLQSRLNSEQLTEAKNSPARFKEAIEAN
jgi:TPR repeat protein